MGPSMGRIQSSVGLVTGIQIDDTVTKLMELNSVPRKRLAARTDTLTKEQTAITTLTTLIIGVQLTTDRFSQSSLFNATKVTSSKSDVLSATSTGTPKTGTYSFVPVRQASSQQLTSSLFAATDQTLSAGTITINTGGFLDESVQLDQLNGGAGVARGTIKITDRSGTSKEVDLKFAETASDVVDAINAVDGLSVVAKLDGDQFVLTDVSGSTSSNLKVEDIGAGTTAKDLGLQVNTASNSASSEDLNKLANSTTLRNLRDGLGLDIIKDGYALRLNLADGTQINYDSNLDGKKATLGQLIDEINDAGDGKIAARISSSGKTLEIQDLTTGSDTFVISSPNGNLEEQLGLTGPASGGIITGTRLQAGLSDTLLSTLNGGQGLGTLGTIKITDKLGNSDTINLSAAQTLDDVISTLNEGASNASFRVQLNQNKTGIEIVDTSGGTGSFKVENDGSTTTATALKIAANTSSSSVNSGSLSRQFVGRNTSIDEFLGGGQTLSKSTFKITDSNGRSANFNVSTRNPKTIGDVIDGINGLGVGVEAQINETGDGILLVDTLNGTGTLSVEEVGTGSAASQLRILGTASDLQVDGDTVSGIDGSKTIKITTTATTTVADLADQINKLTNAPVRANIINLGNSGVRLQLNGRFTGAESRVAVSSDLNFQFSQTAEARDALVSFGATESGGGVLASSSTNTFTDLVEDIQITVNGTSTSPVTVSVAENADTLTTQLQAFVDQYNKLRDKYSELTVFDSTAGNVGLLFGSSVAIRVDQAYSRLLTAPIRSGTGGAIRSLPELGIKLGENGKLTFDKTKFSEALQDNPEAVKDFFTNSTNGFAKRAKEVSDTLAGVDNGALLARTKALQTTIEQNNSRLGKMDSALATQKTRLQNQFYAMEQAISKLQSNLTSINQLSSSLLSSSSS